MIYFCHNNNHVFIRVEGHITAKLCGDIKQKVFSLIEQPVPPASITVDMAKCTYIDSTFIGLLAGFNKKLKSACGVKLEIQNLQDTCAKLLKSMGVLSLLSVLNEPRTLPENMAVCGDEEINAESILDAHETLMDISDENKERFSTLHDVLSSQINETKN